jgi:hypothetical protein
MAAAWYCCLLTTPGVAVHGTLVPWGSETAVYQTGPWVACPSGHTARVTRAHHVTQAQLFDADRDPPEGFVYIARFMSVAQEAQLLAHIHTLPFEEAQYKEWRARRRIVSFGGRYDYSHNELQAAPPIPGSCGRCERSSHDGPA